MRTGGPKTAVRSGSSGRRKRRRRRGPALFDIVTAPIVFVAILAGRLALAGLAFLWRRVERRLPARLRSLCERANTYVSREDRPMRRFVVISGVLHVVCFFLVGILPASSHEARWEPMPLTVSLVTPLEPEAKPKTQPAVQPKPAQPAEQRPKVEEKPKEDVPKIRERKPAKTETQPKPAPREAPPQPRPVTPQQARADTLKAQPSAAVNLQMAARIDESAFTFDYYLPQVVSRISAAWQQPAGISGQGEGPAATIKFRIRRDGAVTNLAVENPSRVALFDLSAQQAVMSAQPLPPLPPAYGGEWLTIHLRFIYTEPRPRGLR